MLKVGLDKTPEASLDKQAIKPVKKGCGCGRKANSITKITRQERRKIITDKMNKTTSSIYNTKAIF